MNEKITYSIAEMAERFEVTYRTLHYYEQKIGFHINRNSSGERIYSEADVEMFESIMDLKSKGMSLDGIRKLFIERNLIKTDPAPNLVVIGENVVMDDKMVELRDILVNAVSEKMSQELQLTKELINKLVQENEELKDTLRKMELQSNDHYSKIDEKLTILSNKKPWYSIFKK